MAEQTVTVPQGTFELLRHPFRERSTLQAWDAADRYALDHLFDLPDLQGPVAIVNEGFGLLTAGLHSCSPSVVTDTAMSTIGIGANLERNGLSPLSVSVDVGSLPGDLGTVVVKVPKSLGQLEEQLHALRPKLSSSTLILGAGMVKQIHTSTIELFESIVGPTTTSLAQSKARLIHSTFDPTLAVPPNPWPVRWSHGGVTVVNRGGIFAAKSIDIGTRLLLDHLPAVESGRAVDLGCGNGIVGLTLLKQNPSVEAVFVDASARAIDSAQRSLEANSLDGAAEFHQVDRLVNCLERSSVDVVLNNPPFHDERAVGDATAWDMFVDSYTVLRPGGELRVVGNQQLGYHTKLNKIFGNCRTVASTKKFVVLSATR